ncbi:hypothetical protein PGT21_014271 [Puccinia graminis f. sp. tritici]|uniref:Spindle pole body-associated protein Vik1/Cik1 microtubule binding domain-containing protein n=1 Tax=Puccinia graminis f. sp. tritici TaxID=56615 RepID=A0A5B0PL13_PUCGR|nr:hypothetical protein PGTUg99_000587 [Puccinia graminis f. sp. tritici]KAA1088930.1 hypothetical protein PGTUg99_035405 [Puccinia graminis f. sp. tritici]KAA1101260.1 hypothetical protein PGT21_014271 [Puccinia graminis f. sp. tritici]
MAQFYPRQAPKPLPETPNPPTLTSWSQQLIQVHQFLAHQAQSTNILQSATAARNHLEVMRTSNQLLAAQGALPENRFNLSLIAYGQTSLDKLFTLGSNSNGSIPKTLEHLFVNMASLAQKNNQEIVKLEKLHQDPQPRDH